MKINYDFGSLGITEANKQEYIKMLDFKQRHFIPAQYIGIDKVSIEIEYDTTGLITYELLQNSNTIFKLQAMRSLVDLVSDSNAIMKVDLQQSNILFGQNSTAYQITRILESKRETEKYYTNQIKALVGGLFIKESVEAIYASEGKLLSKSAIIKNIVDIESLDELAMTLDQIIEEVIAYEQAHYKLVDKQFVQKTKLISNIKTGLIILLVVITGFMAVIYIPNRSSQLKAIEAYNAKVYEDVLVDLADTNVNAMSPVVKYIMTESTVNLSQLSDTQKDNILYNLSPSVEENILDFWVYIGQGDLEAAYDQSIKNNDAQQKAYVLLLLIDQVQNDTSLKTEEKESLLSTYQGELDSITGSMEAEEAK